LENRRSSWIARKLSRSLEEIVRGPGSAIRAICMGIVDAPETTSPARKFDHAARTTATGLTPGWR
jgi:hypothetical protein